mgnify:CR=1 FL=1
MVKIIADKRKGTNMMVSIKSRIAESAWINPLPSVVKKKPRRLVVTMKVPDLMASTVHVATDSGNSAYLAL